ncbi:MAG TPA: hypothetical protein VNI57_09870, partial [Candidatus Saccharimonadales bacterium]|nr:hypothetical protein [Candidatus Saccharimonadales bacterium]
MKYAAFATILLALSAGCAVLHGPGVSPSGTPAFLAGAAKVEITPDLNDADHPVYMAGMDVGLKATSIHDPLYARALVLTDRQGYT